MTLTTSARLRHARAALLQARTLLREAANLGGGLSPLTQGLLRQLANECEESAVYARGLAIQCNRDADDARQKRRKARAA